MRELIITILIVMFFVVLSCLITCGGFWLITLLLGVDFQWKYAIALWLALWIISGFFKNNGER